MHHILSNLIVLLALGAAVSQAVRHLWRAKKAGKACPGCSGCTGTCHKSP